MELIPFRNIKFIHRALLQIRGYGKDITFGSDARLNLMKGIELFTKSVSTAMGPKGRCVIIENYNNSPIITKDGLTVAENIVLSKSIQNVAVKIIQNVTKNTNNKVGDGTKTAAVLAYSIVNEGFQRISKGVNSMELRRGILKAAEVIDRELKEMSIQISSPIELLQVASLSAKNDQLIGEMICQAYRKVGLTGTVTIDNGKGLQDELEIIPGIRIEQGYLSPHFVDSIRGSICRFKDALILLVNQSILSFDSLVSILEAVKSKNAPLLIVTESISSDALAGLVTNKQRSGLEVCVVRSSTLVAPSPSGIIHDIAVATGGTVLEPANRLEDVKIDDLGRAKEICVSLHETVILGGHGKQKSISKRLWKLQEELDSLNDDSKMDELRRRLAQLADGIAVIRVGGSSETEVNEKVDRYKSSLRATRSAIDEGIVAGGGIALLRCGAVLELLEIGGDFQKGVKIVKEALRMPCFTIATNAGVNGDVVIDKLMNCDGNIGYDALTDQYVDMIDCGIIDPVKVVRTALTDAAGLASLLVTTEVVVVDASEM